jgi:hypothetical protein
MSLKIILAQSDTGLSIFFLPEKQKESPGNLPKVTHEQPPTPSSN